MTRLPKKDEEALEEEQRVSVLGTELRDAIAGSVIRILPNIKFRELTRLVAELEVELDNLHQLQLKEDK